MRCAHALIKARRAALGLSELDVANLCGLSVYEYGDIEQHRDELFEVTHLRQAKYLCDALDLEPFEIFGLVCAFCTNKAACQDDYSLPRNELVRKQRVALGFSPDDLGDAIGFETVAIENMEDDPDFFEGWSFELISELASVLKVPPQIFLATKCPACSR